MKRKLSPILISACVILLLMGAGLERDSVIAVTVSDTIQNIYSLMAAEGSGLELATKVEKDEDLLIDFIPTEIEITQKTEQDGIIYVSLKGMAQLLGQSCKYTSTTNSIKIESDMLSFSAKKGTRYLVANGRYLFQADGVKITDGDMILPLELAAQIFGATVEYNEETATTNVVRGTGGIESADEFYDSDDLFWLSRIIFAESGNQPLDGQLGVGIVIQNRVKSPAFPDSIFAVISQKNQFSPYQNGALANKKPTDQCVIAAKLVLDGAVVDTIKDALFFDSLSSSWASRNKTYITTIGGHKFFK